MLGLGDSTASRLRSQITTIVHAAGFTRFDGPSAVARQVNVDGLRNLLEFASACPRLDRFVALSTVYVAGRRSGRIAERELEHDNGFVNPYEESKDEAERLLRAWMPSCQLRSAV